jgi:hypothetical protein
MVRRAIAIVVEPTIAHCHRLSRDPVTGPEVPNDLRSTIMEADRTSLGHPLGRRAAWGALVEDEKRLVEATEQQISTTHASDAQTEWLLDDAHAAILSKAAARSRLLEELSVLLGPIVVVHVGSTGCCSSCTRRPRPPAEEIPQSRSNDGQYDNEPQPVCVAFGRCRGGGRSRCGGRRCLSDSGIQGHEGHERRDLELLQHHAHPFSRNACGSTFAGSRRSPRRKSKDVAGAQGLTGHVALSVRKALYLGLQRNGFSRPKLRSRNRPRDCTLRSYVFIT